MRLLSSARGGFVVAAMAVAASEVLGADAQSLRVFGLNYNARSGPDWAPPATKCKSLDAVKADLALLKTVTDTVRLYSLTDCDQGELVIPAALAAGLNVSVGLWVSADDAVFRAEKAKLEQLIVPERGLFRADRIFDIHVGSEAIYRGDVTPEVNIRHLREIKAVCRAHSNSADIPVTIAEIGDTYLKYKELVQEVDIVSANGFPFWEKWPVETAAEHFLDRMTPLFASAAEHGKRVFISETGWASAGSSANASVASPKNAETYFRDFTAMASKFGWQYFYFAAFDEAWKVAGAGAKDDTVEAHFGIFHADRTLKDEYRRAAAGAASSAAGGRTESAPADTGAAGSSAPPTSAPGSPSSGSPSSGASTATAPTSAPTMTPTPTPSDGGAAASAGAGAPTPLSGSTGAAGGKDKCLS